MLNYHYSYYNTIINYSKKKRENNNKLRND